MNDEEDDVDIEGEFDHSDHFRLGEAMQPPSSYLLPEYAQHPWTLEETWDNDIDDKSRETIERLLTEDVPSSVAMTTKKRAKSTSQSKNSETKSCENLMLNTSRQRKWTNEEKALFQTGLEVYGSSWKDIAELIPGRSVKQVRLYGLKQEKKKPHKENFTDVRVNQKPRAKSKQHIEHTTEILRESFPEASKLETLSDDSDVNIDIESDEDRSCDSVYKQLLKNAKTCTDESVDKLVIEEKPIRNYSNEAIEFPATDDVLSTTAERSQLTINKISISTDQSVKEKQHLTHDVSDLLCNASAADSNTDGAITTEMNYTQPIKNSKFCENKFSNHLTSSNEQTEDSYLTQGEVMESFIEPVEDFGVLNSNGELIRIDPPDKPYGMDCMSITDLERQVHFEFFDNRHNKTPERYVRIRNYILEQWDKCKPLYLNKTSIRNGLRNCGDVNCIGRIHALLEQLGAINFNCSQAVYSRLPMTTKVSRTRLSVKPDIRETENRQRKRRVACNNSNVEGVTIEHGSDDEWRETIRPLPRKVRSKKHANNDLLTLVPYQDFITTEFGAPYEVVVESTAAIIMDIHAHICKTEVMGMLGGKLESGILRIVRAEPCASNSTSVQCEMDPVSLTRAAQLIENAGLKVIGWYHSHPVFAPVPSKIDLESQNKFQNWFAKGGKPFLGIIISPYNSENVQSDIRVFTMAAMLAGDEASTLAPFKLDYKVETTASNPELLNIALRVKQLLEMYAHYEHSVDMLDTYRCTSELSSLEKMLKSIEGYLNESSSSLLMEDICCVVTSMFEKAD